MRPIFEKGVDCPTSQMKISYWALGGAVFRRNAVATKYFFVAASTLLRRMQCWSALGTREAAPAAGADLFRPERFHSQEKA